MEKNGLKTEELEREERLKNNLANINKKFIVISGKGGAWKDHDSG